MATDLERLLISIDASTEGLRREIRRADGSLNKFSRDTDRQLKKVNNSFDGVTKAAKQATAALAAVGVGVAARGLVNYSDNWKRLEGRLRVVTKSQQEFNSVQGQLTRLADQNRSSIESTIDLYARLAMAVGNNETAMKNILPVTEAISKGVAITGESAASASGAIVQFSQGLATNFSAAGQEIRSLQEQAPRVAKALADGLNEIGVTSGATAGQLNLLAKDGVINAQNAMEALSSQLIVLQAEFAQTPKTVGQALTQLDNAFLKMIGTSDAVAESTNSLVLGIGKLSQNLETIAMVAGVAGGVMAVRLAGGAAVAGAAFLVSTGQAVAYQAALARMAGVSKVAAASQTALGVAAKSSLALFGGPYGVALAAVAGGMYLYSQKTEGATEAQREANRIIEKAEQITLDLANATGKQAAKLNQERIDLINNTRQQIANAKARLENIKAMTAEAAFATQSPFALAKVGGGPDSQFILEGLPAAIKTANADIAALEASLEKAAQVSAIEFGPLMNEVAAAVNAVGTSSGSASPKVSKLEAEIRKMAESQKELAISLGVEVDHQERLLEARQQSEEMYESTIDAIERENELRQVGLDLSTEAGQVMDAEIQRRQRLEDQIESVGKAREEDTRKAEEQLRAQRDMAKQMAEEFQRPFQNALDEIQRTTADTFESIFDGSVNSAGDAADAIKSIFIKLAAELAALAVFRPEVLAAGGVGGLLGSSVNGSSSAGFGGISNAVGVADYFSGFTANAGAFSGELAAQLGDGINQAIFDAGFTETGLFGSVGQTAVGLGNAAGGFAGTYLGGKAFGEGTGTTVGGTVGAIAGSFIPVPVLGPLVGSFVGSAIGSLFNGKPSSKLQSGIVDFGTGDIIERGGLTGKKFDQGNFDAVTGLLETSTALSKILGASGNLSAAVSDRYGLEYVLGNDARAFDADSPLRKQFDQANDFFESLTHDLMENSESLNESLSISLKNIDFGETAKDLEQAFADIEFAAGFDNLLETPEALSEVDVALKAVNDNFTVMTETAKRLGLATETVAKAQENAIKAMQDGFNTSIINALNPVAAGVAAEIARYQQHLKDAATLGADTALVDLLHQQNMLSFTDSIGRLSSEVNAERIESLQAEAALASEMVGTLSRLRASYASLQDSFTLGTQSGLSATDRKDAIESEIDRLAPLAQLGNTQAQERLAELLPAFLELSGEVNGFNADYAVDQKKALSLTSATKDVIDRQLSVQEAIAATAEREIDVLTKGFDALKAALSGSSAGSATNSAGRSLSEVTNTGLTVAQVEAIGRSLTGYTGASGSGQIEALIQSRGLGSQFVALMRQAGAKGFATGGLVAGAGGIDNISAMLTDGEFVMRAQAVRSIGANNLAAMNETGRVTNDNSELVAEVRSLRQQVSKLTSVAASSGDMNHSSQQVMIGELRTLANESKIAAFK